MVFTAGQRSIMAEIISYYGHESQKMMLLEEMSELQMLQDAGFEDASKYLDAAWEL